MNSESMAGVTAADMTIENTATHPVSLGAAQSSAAGVVEIHETQIENDVMRMRPIQDGGLIIPAGATVALEPGGYHMMLMDLQHGLVVGDAIAVTLAFNMLDDNNAYMGETVAVTVGVPVRDEAPEPSDFVVVNAWTRPTADAPMADMESMAMAEGVTTATYMTILNRGGNGDRLVAANTAAAGVTEIHETTMENDVMRMRPAGAIDVAAGETIALEPGGYHMMLLDLQRDLIRGEAILVTLVFESGNEVTVAVPVYDALLDDMMLDMDGDQE
jgi:copper(I)-binding protein